MSSSSIADFYAHRNILVTGFTGFLGKVVVEKLIRSCPDIKTIYVLVRKLKDKDAHQRTAKILDSALFDPVRRENPKFLSKIVPVTGDIMDDNLGLSAEDKHTLTNNVTVVFHCAATVKFDEDLRFAMQLNVVGVHRLLKLCHEMKNFAVLIHTSTAYANCNLKQIQEKVYPPPVRAQKLIATLEWMNDDMVRTLSHQLMDIYQRPNTYTFTKTLAEQLMLDESSHLPITIVRPSIIGSSWQEPSPGWIDNLNGVSGLMTAQMKGILRILTLDTKAVADVIPVDTVSNMLIAAGWQRANMTGNVMPVIHCTSGQLNPITWGKFRQNARESCQKFPLLNQLRQPYVTATLSPLRFELVHALNHVLPAYCLDIAARLSGSKPIFVRIVNRLKYAIVTMNYFGTNEWYFASKNLVDLHETLSEEDRKKFNVDIREMDWGSYIENFALGIRQHILKDDLSTVPLARQKAFRAKIVTNTLSVAFVAFVVRLLVRRYEAFGKIWQYIMKMFVRVYHLLPKVRRAIAY